jgi:hypothetical protein
MVIGVDSMPQLFDSKPKRDISIQSQSWTFLENGEYLEKTNSKLKRVVLGKNPVLT